MDVAILENTKFNTNFQANMTTRSMMNSGKIVRDMIGKRLYAYFQHWKESTANYNSKMKTKIKDRILRMYRERQLDAFLFWKKKALQKKKRVKKKMIMEMEEAGK